MDVMFYLVISLLISAVFCYLVFLVKNGMTAAEIQKETIKLYGVGTVDQKQQEKEVINYQGKIVDFTNLLNNRGFASNVFTFIQSQTMPNVWFESFSFDENTYTVQLSGEADNMDAYSGQVAALEGNKYVKDLGFLNPATGQSARIKFSLGITLDKNIFGYLSNPSLILGTTPPSS